jgi:hypothetical protein
MAVYKRHEPCAGKGYLKCEDCKCTRCNSTGEVECSSCNRGKLGCAACHATGEISKKGLIFTRREECPRCRGIGRISCNVCKGSTQIACSSCNGKGRNATCSRCGATQKIKCNECGGSGKVEGQWVKSIRDWPVDRLDFEHKKRQSEISRIELQLSRVQREMKELHEDWDEAYSEAASRPGGVERFDASGYQGGRQILGDQISSINAHLSELNEEMQALDNVLSSKWK